MDRPDAHHHHAFHTSGKLHHLVHPGHGKHFHVVQSPGEADTLRRASDGKPFNENEKEVLLHGSEEHIQALRDIHTHLDAERAALRNKHAACDELEIAILELHAISSEIRRIERSASELDAAVFGKYGYSTNIRTHGEPKSGVASGEIIPTPHTVEEWMAQRFSGDSMKFFRKPILRQYFHQGFIWRAADTQEVASYELFLDLIYVGIIAICGDSAADTADGKSLIRFIITFVMSWKIWQELTMQFNWFDSNDAMRRYYVLLVLTCLLRLATNIAGFWEESYVPLVGFYLAARFAQAIYYAWNAYWLPFVRWPLLSSAIFVCLPAPLWIGSIHVEEYRRQIVIWIAMTVDLSAMGMFWFFTAGARSASSPRRIKEKFAFYPALNIEHRIDRTSSFITIVLGYSVVSTIFQSRSGMGINAFFGKAAVGLFQAYAFNALYFEMDSFNIYTHAIRRSSTSAMFWNLFHLPLILSYVLAGAALEHMVILTDSPNSPIDDLDAASVARSEPELSSGIRWYYCAGLSVALLSTTILAATHTYRLPRQPSILSKRSRLVFRTLVSLVFLLLGLVHSLDSINLIAITSSLTFLCVLVEVAGNHVRDPEEPWWRCVVSGLKGGGEEVYVFWEGEGGGGWWWWGG